MLPSVLTTCLLLAIVLNGLLAGLFFSFSIAIIPGFRRVDDGTYVRSFRAINTAILNPAFLLVFCLAPLSAVATAVLRLWGGGAEPVSWLVIAALCSVVTFTITAGVNVPLNNALDRSEVDTEAQSHETQSHEAQSHETQSHETQSREARQRFESRWNRWNHARTLTSIGAFACFTAGMALG